MHVSYYMFDQSVGLVPELALQTVQMSAVGLLEAPAQVGRGLGRLRTTLVHRGVPRLGVEDCNNNIVDHPRITEQRSPR